MQGEMHKTWKSSNRCVLFVNVISLGTALVTAQVRFPVTLNIRRSWALVQEAQGAILPAEQSYLQQFVRRHHSSLLFLVFLKKTLNKISHPQDLQRWKDEDTNFMWHSEILLLFHRLTCSEKLVTSRIVCLTRVWSAGSHSLSSLLRNYLGVQGCQDWGLICWVMTPCSLRGEYVSDCTVMRAAVFEMTRLCLRPFKTWWLAYTYTARFTAKID
jgi:hypothetical protein